ncbi:MAG: pyridine nucleotide-disulfide oxidoreductase [Microbacterium sp. SCN 70-200]|uniref:NAD(P)-binding domain-containing protein n=1 Tax=unclassified Microbacterium TaxID=2609290 RepID=UPI0008688185|nr:MULTISPECIES: NAD(P)-binding domain-containing protein [unclassified Microbacterium]MBN9213625.1 NAD(P)/FAD-dependent oxidoreductase [Microbacterium sp.]ODT42228.1 MAG: pyridine nucleotide-disulfide oxidoreductase [Microbacterium sp. SCN 70-200]OJV79143.1 MAG: pyridine nucleotide-disulfide oxidoreductase [Microbacterium sp. 70-16]
MEPRLVDVVVIGAGQAGLSAAYHLRRRGYSPAVIPAPTRTPPDGPSFVVLDADEKPGGAWQHRWESLRMATVNGIHELPGFPVPPADPNAPARDVLPDYFAEYERRYDLRVERPVEVRAVRREDDDPHGRLLVQTDRGDWSARYVINATGTWRRPFWPRYPGGETFRGRQLHVHDYVSASEFAGRRVVIVGAGISAVQLLDEISHVANTFWVTRHEVRWDATEFDTAARIAAIAGVEERVRRGEPPGSVISVTGQHRTAWSEAAQARGVLVRHPMFSRIEPDGIRMPDGTLERADVILWATGFRADIVHLAPLALRTPAGGIRVANGRSLDEPRVFLIGYGPSQSTVGANRAGRDAVRAIVAEERGSGSPVVASAHA